MDQELIAYFDDRFRAAAQQVETFRRETSQQIETLRQETTQRFERVEGAIRETQIMVEAGRDEVKLLAEGMIGIEEKLQSFRGDVRFQLTEIQRSIGPYYTDRDRRVRFLEERVAREGQAAIDVVRERYGKSS